MDKVQPKVDTINPHYKPKHKNDKTIDLNTNLDKVKHHKDKIRKFKEQVFKYNEHANKSNKS